MKNGFKSHFTQSLILLASGSFLSQIIVFLGSMIMTRIYPPNQIGEYTLILTAVGMFGSVICAKYDMVIVSEKSEKNVYSLCALCFSITLLLSLIVSFSFFIYYSWKNYSLTKIYFYCFFIFILLVLQGVNNLLISYNNRCREYKLMTSVTLLRAIAKETSMIIGGLFFHTSLMLVFSEMVGTVLGIKRQSKTLVERTDRFHQFFTAPKRIILVALKHKSQAVFSTPAVFANNFSYSSINLFVDSLYGATTLGFYSLSYRLLGMPLTIISSNVSKVYFEEISREKNSQRGYSAIFLKSSLIMFFFALPMTIALFFLSPWFCSLFWGKDYYISGIYLRYLSLMFGVRFIVSPLTVGMIVSRKQHFELIIQTSFVFVSIIVFFVVHFLKWPITKYLMTISIFYTCIYVIYFFTLFFFSKKTKASSHI